MVLSTLTTAVYPYLALRHQLTVYQRTVTKPRLKATEHRGGDHGCPKPLAESRRFAEPHAERLIGSIRRECLDHAIVLNEHHLRRILSGQIRYYHDWRTHLSLDMDCPEPRVIQGVEAGVVTEVPEVGGLHHHYERRVA